MLFARQFLHFILVFLLAVSVSVDSQDDDDDEFIDDSHGSSVLVIEHSFQQGLNPEFKKRGAIHIRSITSGNAQFKEEGEGLTDEDIQELKNAAQSDGIYRIRVRSKRDSYVSSFLKACSLLEAKLEDTLVINMDSSGNVIGISLRTNVPYCLHTEVSDRNLRHFHTEVDLRTAVQGPTPQVDMYIKKIEQEKMEKAKGQQGDNRSFLQKYWMYIIPVVIFMMFTQTQDQGQGGGGGR